MRIRDGISGNHDVLGWVLTALALTLSAKVNSGIL